MGRDYQKGLYNDYELLLSENEKLKITNGLLSKQNIILKAVEAKNEKLRIKNALLSKENAMLEAVEAKNEILELQLEKETAKNEALEKELLRVTGLLNIDSRNSGIPTSKTPLSKNKIIPNSREKSEKKIGGQKGHQKSKLKAFDDNEVSEICEYVLEDCPHCGGGVKKTGETIQKDELDYEVVVIKKRNIFSVCECRKCGRQSHVPIPNRLKEENQYGSRVAALSLSLMNIGNVSVNKVRKMIYGLSEEEINPSEGYIIKQQQKAHKALIPFMNELQKKCLTLDTLYWDDTVIAINKKRGCLRFYGEDNIALYKAHQRKNKEGLDTDGILQFLAPTTVVMHDHNKVNYNKEYSFINIECNAHLLRDLQKTTEYLKHKWSAKLKELITKTYEARKVTIKKGKDAFPSDYVKDFFDQFDFILLEGIEENKVDCKKYFATDELALLKRILDYKDNYLSWVVNFHLPFTNNLSERSLRGIKSKMKISGQFQSVKTAQYYAAIKSYIETCYRNGINETKALIRLCEGNPYTVEEIFNSTSDR